jgi:hypothetical protein
MSSASNLGYGDTVPLSDIDSQYVNVDNSNSAASFGSTQIPTTGGKSRRCKSSKIGGSSRRCKSRKSIKRRIKHITRRYKKHGIKRIKSRLRRMTKSRSKRSYIGGYSQFQNNQPISMAYSVGGVELPASQLALANPPPITSMNNAVDNYSKFTNLGFSSSGH